MNRAVKETSKLLSDAHKGAKVVADGAVKVAAGTTSGAIKVGETAVSVVADTADTLARGTGKVVSTSSGFLRGLVQKLVDFVKTVYAVLADFAKKHSVSLVLILVSVYIYMSYSDQIWSAISRAMRMPK